MSVRLITAFFPGGCPECGGGHTCHEGNALGHAVSCSLKPETQIAALVAELDGERERRERFERALRDITSVAAPPLQLRDIARGALRG